MKVSPASYGFPAGTMVHTDQGLVPIQDIKVGDLVLSRPESGGEHAPTEYKRVLIVVSTDTKNMFQLTYVRESEPNTLNLNAIFLSDCYPLWSEKTGQWVAAFDLEDGDLLSSLNKVENENICVLSAKEIYKIEMNGRFFGQTTYQSGAGILVGNVEGSLRTYNPMDYFGFLEIYRDGFDDIDHADISSWLQCSYQEMMDKRFTLLVFNIVIEDSHTYFVGEDGLWVLAAKP